MTSVLSTPIVNAGILYITGLNLAVGASNVKLNISAGMARDSTDVTDINLATAVVANINNSGLLGLDTGAVAASTFYAVWLIGDSNGINAPSVVFSLSKTAPNLPGAPNQGPGGYDCFRRLGWVKTDSSKHILPFWQTYNVNNTCARKMWYDVPISVLAASASAVMVAQTLSAAVPTVQQTDVQLQVDLLPNAAANFVEIRPTGSSAAAGHVKMSGDVAAVHHFDQIQCVCGLDATPSCSIDWITDAASTVQLSVSAYIDLL